MSAPEPDRAEIDALLALVRARYGDRLDEAAWKQVEEAVTAIAAASRTLRQARLANADAPYPPFHVHRGPS